MNLKCSSLRLFRVIGLVIALILMGSVLFVSPAIAGRIATQTTITGHTPDPSLVGQAVTVNFSVMPLIIGVYLNAPRIAPTGNVVVSDGAISCTGALGPDATGSCVMTFPTAGVKMLVASYPGDDLWAGSTSVAVAHLVRGPSEVPEADTLLLLGGGLGGLATWLGWQWRRAKVRK